MSDEVLKLNDGDPTENIGSRSAQHGAGHVIHFIHVPTKETCHFKAFLTSWQDSFKQTWKSTETVGRMDPIMIYSRTGRQISFSFDVPSYNAAEASFNLLQVQQLIQMSYPTFETVTVKGQVDTSKSGTEQSKEGAQKEKADAEIFGEQSCTNSAKTISTMISPPLFRIKFDNWLNNSNLDPNMTARDAAESGLYGVIENVKFTPELGSDAGGFYGGGDIQTNSTDSSAPLNVLIPKLLKVDLMFTVLHTSKLGYDNTSGLARSEDFPYNAKKIYKKIKVT